MPLFKKVAIEVLKIVKSLFIIAVIEFKYGEAAVQDSNICQAASLRGPSALLWVIV